MKEIEVKKHREMIVVVSALVDEKDETQKTLCLKKGKM